MTNQNSEIADTLQKIYDDILAKLNPKQFKFDDYVTSYKKTKEGVCGTVCCIVGNFSRVYPNSGFTIKVDEWKEIQFGVDGKYKDVNNIVIEHLSKLIGIPSIWVKYLFYGGVTPVSKVTPLDDSSPLKDVRQAWRQSIKYFRDLAANDRESFKYSLS